MNLLIHEGKKYEDLFLTDSTIPDPISTENFEFNIIQTIIKCQLESGEIYKWKKIVNMCMGVSEDTSTGVHHMYTLDKTGTDDQKLERTRMEAMCDK